MSLFEKFNKAYKFLIGEDGEEKEDTGEQLNRSVQQKLQELEAFRAVYEKTLALSEEAEMEWQEEVKNIEILKGRAEEFLGKGDETLALEITREIVEKKEKVRRAENWLATTKMKANKAKEDLDEKERDLDKFLDGVKYLQRIDAVSDVMEKKHKILDLNKHNKEEGANFLFNQASSGILTRSDQVKGVDKLVLTDEERLEKELRDTKEEREALDLLEEIKRKRDKAIEDKKSGE